MLYCCVLLVLQRTESVPSVFECTSYGTVLLYQSLRNSKQCSKCKQVFVYSWTGGAGEREMMTAVFGDETASSISRLSSPANAFSQVRIYSSTILVVLLKSRYGKLHEVIERN